MKTDAFCDEQNKIEFHRGVVNVAPAFDLALHTAKPTSDRQTSNEVTVNGYARVSVMRDKVTWIVRDRKITNAQIIRFPTVTSGKAVAKWLSIGIAGQIRRLVRLDQPIDMKPNHRVEFEIGAIEINERGDE